MRLPVLLASAFLAPLLAAQAQSISVNKGQWRVDQDSYFRGIADGEVLDMPPEFSSIDECWTLDEEVLIDESMVAMFEGCVSTGSKALPYGVAIGVSCDFDGLLVGGTLAFSVSHTRDSFSAHLQLNNEANDGLDFQSDLLMIGHRTGTCQAPS
ncbi:DUF3617 domain-containing protein [Hyphomonas sp. WL0036]|uniref:DUF3617 domain-containing protein n=1 Tax=Hyphomonas sediminis TaxID=2866160 RepID=UPI001C823142|nr:DUF3617 domain-containing protein [Hyphomonas sediminis]MBY9065897.1 DUF3617 domain-containing protein [Hyphomonas sediminis]